MIRFGIVGCGSIHKTHVDAIEAAEGAVLAAVQDVVPERAQKAGEAYGVFSTSKLAKLFQKVDVVTIAAPSGLHAEIGIKAARAGKHVLSEKPIDVDLRKAEALVMECKKAGVTLGVISQHRFAKDIRAVRDAVQGGAFGKVLMADCYTRWYRTQAYYNSGDWRGTWKLDGGALLNQSVHYVDMLQWVAGKIVSVQARIATMAHTMEAEDVAYALCEFENGALGVIHGSTAAYPGFAERVEVYGEYGSAIIEADRLKHIQVDPEAPLDESPYGKAAKYHPIPKVETQNASTEGTGAADPTAIWGEQHKLQVAEYVAALREKRDPEITGEMALEPLKIIRAIYKSGKMGGRRVEVG